MRAQLEYRGTRGITRHCLVALANFLQECRTTGRAILLSTPADDHGCRSHAFLLLLDDLPEVLVLDGFASGYGGEGPRGLSTAICLLDTRRWDMNEVELTAELFERLCARAATQNELQRILKLRRKPVSDVFRYVPRENLDSEAMKLAWRDLPINIPLPMIDVRLFDVAIAFWDDPDSLLSKAYRRLEDSVRDKTGFNSSNDHGARLFSRAFGNDKSPFVWLVNGEETTCYAPLFTAAFTGFRNNRAHRDPGYESDKSVAGELLLLNMLYLLEAQVMPRSPPADAEAS